LTLLLPHESIFTGIIPVNIGVLHAN
jgi:hypothetical protein